MTELPNSDDDPEPKKPPKFCPWCGGAVTRRWTTTELRWLAQRRPVRVAHVCLTCKIAVRAFKFPHALFVSKKAAQMKIQREHDDLEVSGFTSVRCRDLYARGKCSCSPPYTFVVTPDPCAVHRPLPRRSP